MKQITLRSFSYFFLLFTLSFLFPSCMDNLSVEKEELKQDNQTALIYQKMIQAEDDETRKMINQTLSYAERIDFWKYHIDQLISNQTFNKEQVKFLHETKVFATQFLNKLESNQENDFSLNPQAQCVDIEGYFEDTPKEIFSPSELIQMFTLTNLTTAKHSEKNNANSRSALNCNCTWNSHCPSSMRCSWYNNLGCVRIPGCGMWSWCECIGRCV